METIRKGRTAEAAVLAALVEADLEVLEPFGGASPYDLAVDYRGRLIKIQVKNGRLRGDVVICNTCSTDHGRGRQTYHGVADVLAIWVGELRRIFVLSVDTCPTRAVSLRLTPARNNQKHGVRYAAEHSLERWLTELGA